MKDTFIIDGIRTPIGKFGGTLGAVRADDLAALVIKKLMSRNSQIDPALIEDVILGCANQAGEDNRNVARMASLLAGLPYSVPGETVNRLCASGMSAIVQVNRAIKTGDGDMFIAGGVENMTRGPWVISKSARPFGTDAKMYDSSFGWRFINPQMEKVYGTDSMGMTAENLVEIHNISREDQDAFAYSSQMKAAKAQASGRLAEEIVAVEIPQRKKDPIVFNQDEFIKANTTQEILAGLRPAFKNDGSVTAGNASGLNDGAAAVLVASEEAVKANNLAPKARVVASGVVGVEPRIMGIGPVKATQKALKKAGLTLDQMDVIEINEAFAAQSLSCTRALGLTDNDERINPNGGAIAIGHPLGMTGARITYSAALELQKTGKRYALATMCVGVGQGYAIILENVG
ncbi:3-oxoadipyl-CoA thiolase [Roseivirga pacifica]|uniref:3-oxoadipyl-CoA thiolase n=1 Tax=Roseivirga pacifica TaxID=1267423 RepID=UPI0020964CC1|nr:3-oxoadipyl-CoA thiolase [Roseivirga pacifica]MCO6357799.1 3-oxoadipyl-CoA thiolase [Roseivirga pacifica]MCO6366051.1 3-oxoadipyl-CoA thiolase [Roseivirga pacifica]MCO6371379.1 3-oxoadipyl-CoA thiolase [Roseivirga pacifica]MCO6375449.1 3-oxoadipyl-CoA thiolase [Roseivirga pacifica]MCO6378757.1 3-oxoadipyl-CoA thiolase [Roseivirga pacifica]